MPTERASSVEPRFSPKEKHDASRMRAMFTTISPRYDLFTRTFSLGMDPGWKRVAVAKARLPEGALVLDLAAGTGDFTRLIERADPGARSVATDLTLPMLSAGRREGLDRAVCGDAMHLPFGDETFDAVFVGYGMRNFPELAGALTEIRRVLKLGGQLVSLDFFLPSDRVLRAVYLRYLYIGGWVFGLLLHGAPRIYTYIRDSLRDFVTMAEYEEELAQCGLRQTAARRYLFGGIGLHWAERNEWSQSGSELGSSDGAKNQREEVPGD